jgi:hypothetical protein
MIACPITGRAGGGDTPIINIVVMAVAIEIVIAPIPFGVGGGFT